MVNLTNGNPPHFQSHYSGDKPQKSGKSLAVKVGLIILAVLIVLSLAVLAMILFKEKPYDTAKMIELLQLEEKPRINTLDGVNVKELIHINMPKDSVLMVLGRPTDYRKTDWADDIIYEFGDSTYLRVSFEDGLVVGFESTQGNDSTEVAVVTEKKGADDALLRKKC